jgi:catechol 2,3-dioxygenase-like lactoylglutathione lyase family enzyme
LVDSSVPPGYPDFHRTMHCPVRDTLTRFVRRLNGQTTTMIGRLRNVVLDTRDPRKLADFYAQVLGARLIADEDDWVTVEDDRGVRLSFQLSPEHAPPAFPDTAGSQQIHLDIQVGDIDTAERDVLALGATRVREGQEEQDFRVFRDPAGHTFCLVYNV